MFLSLVYHIGDDAKGKYRQPRKPIRLQIFFLQLGGTVMYDYKYSIYIDK